MKYFLLLSLLIASAPRGCEAADFTVRITRAPLHLVQGEPIKIMYEVKNASGKPLVIARGLHGFEVKLIITREDGKPRRGCIEPGKADFLNGYSKETLPEGWSEVREEDRTCEDEPGVLIASVSIHSSGPYPEQATGGKVGAPIKAWSGEAVSEIARIEIRAPQGTDKAAYLAFGHNPLASNVREQLLTQHPTSVYAGYVLATMRPAVSQDIRQELGFGTLANG